MATIRNDLEVLKQTEDVVAIRGGAVELKKEQVAQDVKLQNHDHGLRIRKKTPIEELLVGKWKMASSTDREEYEMHMVNYSEASGLKCPKISYNNRSFTYNGGILESFVGNHNVDDPTFSKDYKVEDGKLVYEHTKSNFDETTIFQSISIWLEKDQLIVNSSVHEEDDDSESNFKCECIYERA